MRSHNTEPSQLAAQRVYVEAEIAELRRRLDDAEDTLHAIKSGRVDALVIDHPSEEHQVVLLGGVKVSDRLLIDRLEQAAVLLSRPGEVVHVNPAFAALLGVHVEHCLGQPFSRFVDPAECPSVEVLLDLATTAATAEIVLRHSADTLLRAHITPVPMAEGGGVCLIVTPSEHVTAAEEERDTVRAIRRGEIDAVVVSDTGDDPRVLLLGAAGRRYRLLVEHMNDGAVTLSARGDVLYANPRFAAMLGTAPDAIVGRRVTDFLDPQHTPLIDALLSGRGGTSSQVELTVRRADGAAFDALLTLVPSGDEHGLSFLLTDVTQRRRLDEAEEALRAIGSGQVDAFVVAGAAGSEVEMLSGAHRPYRLMVERMQQGAVTLSPAREILYTNQPFATMLGRSLGDMIGVRLDTLVAPPDRPLLDALLRARQGAATQGEIALLHASGAHVPVLVGVALLPEEGGVCLIVTDLTAQKAYEAILAAQALERSILDQAIDAIVLCDSEGRVIRASRAAFDLCGANPLLRRFEEVFPLAAPDGLPPDVHAVQTGATTLRGLEYTLRRPDRDVAVLLSAGPVIDADGNSRGAVVTMTDITERRVAEDRLRESDRRKDEFLAILAHELRNPLAPIRSAVEILRHTDLRHNPTGSYATEIIGRQVGNLIRLVDDLLDINRINQGKVTLERVRIDMRDVVDQAVEICRPLLNSRRHQYYLSLPDEPVHVNGDAVRLSQVVVNVLTNAANYTQPGGRIDVALAAEGNNAVVRVTDNGIGISPEMLSRIFEPYQQASRSRERTTGGLGLGLTVCRRLIEMHGGTVEVHSEGLGRGSQFVVRLALAEPLEAQHAPPEPAAETTSSRRVFVIDDNRDAAETLARLMEMWGHDVSTYTSGPAALEAAAASLPEVVLLDLGMPGMDGFEVARRLRALPDGSRLRVIAMTGYGGDEDRRKSAESGIDEHLVKPVDFTALQNLLGTE
jgi:PAS domain S-box-containing protein